MLKLSMVKLRFFAPRVTEGTDPGEIWYGRAHIAGTLSHVRFGPDWSNSRFRPTGATIKVAMVKFIHAHFGPGQ